jgi:two-component system phosphate regulon response regulator PhoB
LLEPYAVRELVRCVGALAATQPKVAASPVVAIGPASVDLSRAEVRLGAAPIALTPLELKLIRCLHGRRAQTVSRALLLHEVWQLDADIKTRTVDTHVKRLREKLGEAARCIETVRGVGYRLMDECA